MYSPSTNPFGEALRGLMQARGLTYRALAQTTRELGDRGLYVRVSVARVPAFLAG